MNLEDDGHVFIFHGDDDPRPPGMREGEFLFVGKRREENDYPMDMKETFFAPDLQRIRERSAFLNRFLGNQESSLTHIFPDPSRRITKSALKYVVRNLRADIDPSRPQGSDQLQGLSEICSAIWLLECTRDPFLETARTILKNCGQGQHDTVEGAKCLTIVAFVLGHDGHDFELKRNLESLVWHSSGPLNCPIVTLQTWVEERRKRTLGRIHDFLFDEMNHLEIYHPDCEPNTKIRQRLKKENPSDPGIGDLLFYSWTTHLGRQGGLLGMSPREVTDNVREAAPLFRAGTGGKVWRLAKTFLPKSSRKEVEEVNDGSAREKGVRAICERIVENIQTAEARRKNEIGTLGDDEIAKLIAERDKERRNWGRGCLGRGRPDSLGTSSVSTT